MQKNIEHALSELGGLTVKRDSESIFGASLDHSRYSAKADAVVFARNADDVSRVLKIAYKYEIPVTARGAGSGCSGGAVPLAGGIVLDLSAIDFIEIDPLSKIAHVGAGAVTANIDAAANKFGLFYAPDPSSHKYCTIGGNIAHNAGGLRAAKYGTTRDNLMALIAVLADGTKVRGGRPLRKFSAGLDLRDIFVGSEGTLGIVVEAWLKLLPLPESTKVALAVFDGDSEAFAGIEKILRSSLQPSILEFMDSDTVACVRKAEPSLEIRKGGAALLAQFDGSNADACGSAEKFTEMFSYANARMSRNKAEEDILWKVRRAASPAMYELGDSKVGEDIVIPFDKVVDYFSFFKKLGRDVNLPSPVFGHAADGNYHVHFMYNDSESDGRTRAWNAMEKAVEKVAELGGAISGEHGIGFLKSKFMHFQHSEAELDLMRTVKHAMDPKNILNPRKLYDAYPNVMKPLRGVKLPWDK